jgi:hypothetical protein
MYLNAGIKFITIDIMKRVILFLICGVVFFNVTAQPVAKVPLKKYLEFARSAADWTWEKYDSLENGWIKGIDPANFFGYRPPARFLEAASIYATLFEMEGNRKYAERAKSILLRYDGYTKYYPESVSKARPDYSEGTPALPDFFTTMRYIRPFEILHRKGILSAAEADKMGKIIIHNMNYLLQSQEWGAMNRAALRAETLGWAIKALPDIPEAVQWRSYERALGADNWGNWEIEDATLYHAIWLYAMMSYAESKGQMKELFATPEMYYYSKYFLNLMAPYGMVSAFGDSRINDNWDRWLVYFEAAANYYSNPQLKWAASVISDKFINFGNRSATSLGYELLDCYRWGNDRINPEKPQNLSQEVMEDVQGKKIVMRSGWEPGSSFLLLNYKDEGESGQLYRDYLRDGIAVEEEKLTHGHSDENSIALLMSKGSILLADGGYRDYMPSGPYGNYRQDYFHNRLVVRPEKIFMGQKEGENRYNTPGKAAVPGQSVLDFVHNAGSHRQVRTNKIDFITLPDFDYSRTRLTDEDMGYEWDRIVAWIKDPGIYVVFDILKGRKEQFMTAANMWHTRKIVASGPHWYDTMYDSVYTYRNNTDYNLMILFPKNHYRLESVEPERRNYNNELLITEYSGQFFELGQHAGFITVLIPHDKNTDASFWKDRIKLVETGDAEPGLSVEINTGTDLIQVGVKSDLRMDMIRDYRRPKYTYESGRVCYDRVETNGDFFITRKTGNNLSYTVVNVTKMFYDGKLLFSQKPNFYGMAFDGGPEVESIGKVRYWRDSIDLNK